MTREVVRNYHYSAQRNEFENGCHVAAWEERMDPAVAAAAVLRAFVKLQADMMRHGPKHEQWVTGFSGVQMLEWWEI